MSTTILDRAAQAMRGNRTRVVVGFGVAFVLVGAAAGAFLLTGAGAAPRGTAAPTPNDAHLQQVHGLPAGATDCPPVYPHVLAPYNRGARGTPATSCPFVEEVRMTYAKQPPSAGPRQLRVPSPATYKWYDLVCAPTGSFVTCTGGVAAVIYLYNLDG